MRAINNRFSFGIVVHTSSSIKQMKNILWKSGWSSNNDINFPNDMSVGMSCRTATFAQCCLHPERFFPMSAFPSIGMSRLNGIDGIRRLFYYFFPADSPAASCQHLVEHLQSAIGSLSLRYRRQTDVGDVPTTRPHHFPGIEWHHKIQMHTFHLRFTLIVLNPFSRWIYDYNLNNKNPTQWRNHKAHYY